MKSMSSGCRLSSLAKKLVLKGCLDIRDKNYSTVFSDIDTRDEPANLAASFLFLAPFLTSRYFFLLKNLIIMLVNSLLSFMKYECKASKNS